MAGIDMDKFTSEFQQRLYNVYTHNELAGPKDEGRAYSLSFPCTNASGYTFGWVQFDLPQQYDQWVKNGSPTDNKPEPLTILENAIDDIPTDELMGTAALIGMGYMTEAEIKQQIVGWVETARGNIYNSRLEYFRPLISDELQAGYWEEIDDASVVAIQENEAYVQNVIDQITDPTSKFFVEQNDIAKFFIADVKNQYGTDVNNNLIRYLNGDQVKPSEKAGGIFVQVDGQFGIEDLIRTVNTSGSERNM